MDGVEPDPSALFSSLMVCSWSMSLLLHALFSVATVTLIEEAITVTTPVSEVLRLTDQWAGLYLAVRPSLGFGQVLNLPTVTSISR